MGFMLTRPSIEWSGWGVWDAIWDYDELDASGMHLTTPAGWIWQNFKGGFTAEFPGGRVVFVGTFAEAVDVLALPFYHEEEI
jgi:hypothetical protein